MAGRAADSHAYYYSVGYNGHGVAQATAMGGLLADLMLGKHNPWHEVIFRKPAYMPAKPLRYLAVKSLLGALNGIDRRIDRKIAAAGIAP